MTSEPSAMHGGGRVLQGIGLVCWALVVPIKVLRVIAPAASGASLVGIAPSFLAAAGLFLVLAGGRRHGRWRRLSLARTAFLVGASALAVEFAQLLPRPGILARVSYTFDWLDVAASIAGVGAAYLLARLTATRTRGRSSDQEGRAGQASAAATERIEEARARDAGAHRETR